jgi:hypothetical protein
VPFTGSGAERDDVEAFFLPFDLPFEAAVAFLPFPGDFFALRLVFCA